MTDDQNAKREKAREAMEGEEHREAREMTEAELNLRRHRARIAMESHEQKQRREDRDRKRIDAEAAAQKLAAEHERQKRELAEQEAQLRQTEAAKQEAEEQLKQDRINKVQASEAMIQNIRQDKSVLLSALRTLRSDIERAVTEEHMSLTQMAIKEQTDRRLKEKRKAEKSAWSWTLTVGFILILMIAGGSYAVWQYLDIPLAPKPAPVQPKPATRSVTSIIFAEEHTELKTENQTAEALMEKVRQIKYGNTKPRITHVYLTKPNPEGTSYTRLGLRPSLTNLGIQLPPTIVQFLNERFMLGVYRGSTITGFLIITTEHFENTVYGLVQHESAFAKAIYPLITAHPLPTELMTTPFKDKVVKNTDARYLADKNGRIVLLYAFLDRNTIVITGTEEALETIKTSYITPAEPAVQ